MMTRPIYSFILLFLLNFSASAQDQQFGMINMAASAANPAYTGWNNKWTAGLNYQNSSINNTLYETTSLYGEYAKNKHAVGLNIFNDVAGVGMLTTRKVMANYSYHYSKQKFGLRLGIGLGFAQKSIDFSKLTFSDQIDPRVGFGPDTSSLSPSNTVSFGLVNIGAVGYYKNIYLSFAAHQVNNPNQSFYQSTKPGSYLPVRYHIQLGGYIPLSKNFTLYPSIRYNKQKQFDMLMPEVQVAYKNFVVGCSKIFGINNKNINIGNFNMGYTINQKYKLGYMYNYGKLSSTVFATHEFSFVFMMNKIAGKGEENILRKYMRKFL